MQIRRGGSQAGRALIPPGSGRVGGGGMGGEPQGLLLDSQSTARWGSPFPGRQEADSRLQAQRPAGLTGPTPDTVPVNLSVGRGHGGQSPEMGP